VRLENDTTAAVLKEKVGKLEGHDVRHLNVLSGARFLDDEDLLGAAGVGDCSTVYLLGGLEGGAKKRKKKVYTKPKKQKHKPRKEKLRTLKYYKVDDSGKVQRMRKLCPEA